MANNKRDVKVFEREVLTKQLAVVVGTRPGIVMIAPIIKRLQQLGVPHFVIHSGQHYSPEMDDVFFQQLNLEPPKYRLEGVSNNTTHGAQTAAMLTGIERLLMLEKPVGILVGGDANTNLSAALAARKLRMFVGHIEAGERSYDWRMPEEHNRRMIDHISDILFATNEKSKQRLLDERVAGRVIVTGNPIVDAVVSVTANSSCHDTGQHSRIDNKNYCVLTLHREENVDFEEILNRILVNVSKITREFNVTTIFPIHPRTKKRLIEFGLFEQFSSTYPNIKLINPQGYNEFIPLIKDARFLMTDSGGAQQEACILQCPTITLRENTEWVETVQVGANKVVGADYMATKTAVAWALSSARKWSNPFGEYGVSDKIISEMCDITGIERKNVQ